MNRRNFFATLFGGLLAKFLPKAIAKSPITEYADRLFYFGGARQGRIDRMDLSKWGQVHQVKVFFVSKSGYITEASPEPSTWGIRYMRDGTDWLNLKRS